MSPWYPGLERGAPRFEVSRVTSKLKLVERTILVHNTGYLLVLGGQEVVKRAIDFEKIESVSLQREGVRSLLLVRVHPTTPESPDLLLSIKHMPEQRAQEVVSAIQQKCPEFPALAPGVSLQATARLAHGPYHKLDAPPYRNRRPS